MNSLESTGTMPSGGRLNGRKQHTQLVYKDGEAIVVDPTVVQVEQEIMARHQQVLAKKANHVGLRKWQNLRPKLQNCKETKAKLRAVIE